MIVTDLIGLRRVEFLKFFWYILIEIDRIGFLLLILKYVRPLQLRARGISKFFQKQTSKIF